jgi:hypothetical protein
MLWELSDESQAVNQNCDVQHLRHSDHISLNSRTVLLLIAEGVMAVKFDRDRVELLGVEIIFTGEDDPRGSVWVPTDETMSIFYGQRLAQTPR